MSNAKVGESVQILRSLQQNLPQKNVDFCVAGMHLKEANGVKKEAQSDGIYIDID